MALDTDTKKINRWFRVTTAGDEFEHLLDFYWGGKERRITGLTLKIIGVNIIAVFSLILGVIYLGQYHAILIEAKLEQFGTESVLVTTAISNNLLEENTSVETNLSETSEDFSNLDKLTARLAVSLGKRILIFDKENTLVIDSQKIIDERKTKPYLQLSGKSKNTLSSIEILKATAGFFASVFTSRDNLDLYEGVVSFSGEDYPNVVDARRGEFSLSAWRNGNKDIVLTAALPIYKNREVVAVVMLVSEDERIREELADVWFNILNLFLLTLLITIFLSIYLSGVIARPLRKLAVSSENVRKGKLKYTDIPDMRDRHDEIGDLSVVLRDMTAALLERMDSIESFAADVAHEIKNPLTSLKSAVETAEKVTKKSDREKLLAVIKHDVDRLDRLITDISNASRLDAELSRETFRAVNMKSLLQNAIDLYKNPLERDDGRARKKTQTLKDGVMITLSIPEEDEIYVLGSEGRLMQVIHNIVSNALSFAPVKSEIKILMQVDRRHVNISFEDEGPGIPENKLKTIFERFYSERPDYEEYGQHSGLGLSICKQIIMAHKGVIYAENRKDRDDNVIGAKFVVSLNLYNEKKQK
ncbi:MAG: HAMP domain-containing protein [Alphaproteobacteria bacterium]|nr:HAMP domain-containing protein [Alphaproteobacteria bacterium]